MVEESGIAAPACGRVLAPYYSQGMAALPPRSSRRRPRRGSLERPVSGRLYRGTWLLVGIPLLVAAFSVHKPGPLPTPQPALPASFDGPSAIALASRALPALSRPRTRECRRGRGGTVVPRPAGALPTARRARSLPRQRSGPRRARARQPGRDHSGPVAGRDRDPRAPGRFRRGAGCQQQRLGHRRPDPARPLVRHGRRRPPGQPPAHARLRRHRRRRVRRPGRPPLRRDPSRARSSPRSRSTRSPATAARGWS